MTTIQKTHSAHGGTGLEATARDGHCRLVVRSQDSPGRSIDVTDEVVAIIARAMFDLTEGNEVLNWMEAETLLDRLLAGRSATQVL